jgi:hypothetical protein
MIINRVSPFTGKVNTMNLPITEEQIARWKRGAYAQDVWPDLTPSQREFLISGSTEEDWETYITGAFEEEDD